MVRVLFVCLGNICRSPTAEGVMRHLVEQEGLGAKVGIDSAGTGAWHAGESPDRRSAATARRRGIVLEGAARQVRPQDFEDFDYVLAMDRSNLRDLERIARGRGADAMSRLHLFRDFDPTGPRGQGVPDPYYGGHRGFEEVLDICQRGCEGLLDHLRTHHGL